MLKNVCNEDMKVSFSNQGGPPDLIYLGDQSIDTVNVVPTLSNRCTVSGRKIATEKVTITWAISGCAFTSATHKFVSGAAAIFSGAWAVRADGQAVLLEGDRSIAGCVGTWTNTSSGATVSCSCGVEIASAGQDKCKAQ